MNPVKCSHCSSSDTEPINVVDGIARHSCRACGLPFFIPSSQEDLRRRKRPIGGDGMRSEGGRGGL
ncbi:MAG: hypothetical protein NT137_08510 [Methanomassiliicoccales archaeon]|nr:hypothetical protein [Methanomassiliicoccales archaeon]